MRHESERQAEWTARAGGSARGAARLALALLLLSSAGCAGLSGFRSRVPDPGAARLAQLMAGGGPRTCAFEDFDGDGQPELVWANYDSGTVTCLEPLGGGRFREREIPVGQFPGEMVSADFDGDGFPDLAVANRLSDSVTILRGGRGGLRPAAEIPVGAFPEGLLVGDFDQDRLPDLLVSSRDSGTVTVLHGSNLAAAREVAVAGRGEGPQAAPLAVDLGTRDR